MFFILGTLIRFIFHFQGGHNYFLLETPEKKTEQFQLSEYSTYSMENINTDAKLSDYDNTF